MREAKPGPFSAPSAGEGTRSQYLHGVGRNSSTARNLKLATRSVLLNVRIELPQKPLTEFALKRKSRSLELLLGMLHCSPFPVSTL
jgi:hypothetical protein